MSESTPPPPSSPSGSTPAPTPDPATLLRSAREACDDPASAELAEILRSKLPDYRVGPRIGRGGMGVVFRARQPKLQRDVAIKVLTAPPRGTGSDQTIWRERFLREAQSLAKLSHPGIVKLYDFGEEDGVAWIVMELIEGPSLRDLLQMGAMAPEEALAIVPALCSALQFAHDRGIIHRDIKPENILIQEDGTAKLVDFGLAKLTGDEATPNLTGTGEAMGTVRYMAPEQLDEPRVVDHRADIFSMGVVLYEMLTGHVPQGVIEPPSRTSSAPESMDQVVLTALARQPERRFESAEAMGTTLEHGSAAAPEASPSGAEAPIDGESLAISTPESDARIGQFVDCVLAILSVLLLVSYQLPLALLHSLCILAPTIAWRWNRRLPSAVLRASSGLVGVLIAMAANGFPPESLSRESAWWRLLTVAILISCVQLAAATFTRRTPNGLRWSPTSRPLFYWTGLAFLFLLTLGSSGGSPTGLLYLGVTAWWISQARSKRDVRLAKDRTYVLAIVGMSGCVFMWMGASVGLLAAPIGFLALLLAAFEGAGTPHIPRPPAR